MIEISIVKFILCILAGVLSGASIVLAVSAITDYTVDKAAEKDKITRSVIVAFMEVCEKDDKEVCIKCPLCGICKKGKMNIDKKDSDKRD